MAGRQSFDELKKDFSPERMARIEGIKSHLRLEMALSQLRELRGYSQKELGEKLGVRQPAVARMEKRNDMLLSTLRATVEAMGGELELIAKFPDDEVCLTGLTESKK